MKGIGICANKIASTVDHLVPLSLIMGIPILCENREIFELIDLYYPHLNLILESGKGYSYDTILKEYSVFFYVNPSRKATGAFQFYDHLYRGGGRSVCGFHGNSDKKEALYWLEQFADEDIILVYGKQTLDFFEKKGILDRLGPCVLTGNYRYEYYLENKEFFDSKVKHHLFPKNLKKTILYAPTWAHPNRQSNWRTEYTPFFKTYRYVFDALPNDYQLLVKLHPMLVEFYPDAVEEIKEKYQGRENILFLNEVPLIYPILSTVDYYLGDYSSIGYDFLAMNRPLFFLNDRECSLPLYKTGTPIYPDSFEKLYQILEKKDEKEDLRQEMVEYAFGKRKGLKQVKQEIEAAYT